MEMQSLDFQKCAVDINFHIYILITSIICFQFLVYDTQMVIGGRKHELSPEDYVSGALQLYIDVVYLFLILLACFGKGNG